MHPLTYVGFSFIGPFFATRGGEIDEGVESLNELLTSYPGFEGNVRQTLRADLLTNPKIRWPKRSASANTKP
jgi:hypothetical protein